MNIHLRSHSPFRRWTRLSGPWNVRTTLVTLLVLALLPALVIGYVLLRSEINEASESARDDAVRAAVTERQLAVAALTAHLDGVRATVQAAASFDAVQRLDIEEATGVLNVFTRSNASLASVELIDPRGQVLVSSSSGLAPSRSELLMERAEVVPPHIAAALHGQTRLAVVGGLSNEPALILAVPIRTGADGSVVGALESRLSAMELAKSLSAGTAAADLVVLNQEDGAPFVSVTQGPHPIIDPSAAAALAAVGAEGPVRTQSQEDPIWVSGEQIPLTPFVVAVAALERPPARIRALLATTGYFAIGPAAIGLLAVYLSHRLLDPVVTLTETARAVTAGDHDRRARIESRMLEVNEIGQAFDEMLDELAQGRHDLTRSREQVHELLQRTFLIQEEDRHRIALDLHDRVAQLLVGALYELQSISDQDEHDHSERERVERAISVLRLAEREMRRVIFEVRPPVLSAGGLASAIETFVEEQREHFIKCSFIDQGLTARIPERVAAAAYRVVQEAIRNAAKHAAGSHLWVIVSAEGGWLEVQVTDDGPGFQPRSAIDPNAPHLGIVGMQERAQAVGGAVSIEARPGLTRGTRVVLRIPIDVDPPTDVSLDATHDPHSEDDSRRLSDSRGVADKVY